MKKLFIIVTTLVSWCITAQKLTYEKGTFYQLGKPISNKNVKAMLEKTPKALELYKASKSKEIIGGFVLGFGGGLVVADLATGLFADIKYPTTATYIGLGAIIVSIPILSGRTKKMNQALELHHANLPKTSLIETLQMNFITNKNGLGLAVTF